MNHSLPKTTYASDAFFRTMLGLEVELTLNQVGTDVYRILQHDQYHLIVETPEGDTILIAKSAVIAVVAPQDTIPELHRAIAHGVTAINYRASQKRTEANRTKPTVRVKPNRSY